MNEDSNPSREELLKRIEILSDRLASMEGEISKARDEIRELRGQLPESDLFTQGPETEEPPTLPPLAPQKKKPESELIQQPVVHLPPKKTEEKKTQKKPISPELGSGYPSFATEEPVTGDTEETIAETVSIPPHISGPDDPVAVTDEMDFETRIGAVWFNRIGLVILVIGISLMARYVHPFMEPWHKVAIGYLFAFALFGVGRFFEERLQMFARPVMAGGMAVAFFTSFAGHFVEAMECLSLWPSLFLMTFSVGWIVAMAEKWKSEATAGLAIFLGHVAAYTAGGQADAFSLIAILFLSATGCALFVRHDWAPLNLFTVLAAFGSHMLWAFQDHPPSTPQIQFWVNFSFLTSYYVLFTCSEVVYRSRVFERGIAHYTDLQRQAARVVGPAALVLYASLATLFFQATEIYWEQIHFFWFPLAALQVGLAYFHREKTNPDYPIYGVAATIFLTLGLASWLGGFSLNLALAAEALMLLVLARRLRLWFLNPLAQVVLAINFFHFWYSGASEIDTWPIFIGSVATALVYFVKSRIEGTWEKGVRDERVTESIQIAALRETFDDLVRPLSYIHAIAGAFLLVYLCGEFFDRGHAPLPISLFASALILAALIFRSAPYVPAVWLLAIGLIVRTFQVEPLSFEGAPLSEALPQPRAVWFLTVSSAQLVALFSWLALFASRWLRSRLFLVLGVGGLALSSVAYLIALGVGDPIFWLLDLALIIPLILWIETDRGSKGCGGNGKLKIANPLEEMSRFLNPAWVQIGFSLLAGLATFPAIASVVESPSLEILLLSLAAFAVLVAALVRDAPHFGIGLFILTFLSLKDSIHGHFGLETATTPYWMWGCAFASLLVATGAFAGAMTRGRASFAWLGIAVLAVLQKTVLDIGIHGTGDSSGVAPYPLWILLIFAMWLAIEIFRETFSNRKLRAYKSWADRLGIKALLPFAPFIAIAFSVSASLLLYRYSVAFFDHRTNAAWAVGIYSIPLFLLAGVIRSYSLGIGGMATLTFAHLCVYLFNGPNYVGGHHPFLMIFLVALPLIIAGVLESSTWKNFSTSPKNLFFVSIGASVYLHTIAFLLGRYFVEEQTSIYFDLAHASFPFHMAFALIVLIAGWRFKNSWMEISAIAYAGLASLGFVLQILDRLKPQQDVFLVAGLMAIQLIVMERLLHGQPKAILDRVREGLSAWVHAGLVPFAAVLLIVAARFSEELRLSWMTLSYSLVGTAFMGLGFFWRDRVYRRTALAVFVLCIARVIFLDIMNLEGLYRIVSFICLGSCLLVVSWLYTRFQKQVHQWI